MLLDGHDMLRTDDLGTINLFMGEELEPIFDMKGDIVEMDGDGHF